MKWLVVLSLAACVTPVSELREPVDADVARRLGAPVELGATDPRALDALLAHPVDCETAVRIALLASPELRGALDELGIAGGDLATALAPGPARVDVQLRHGGGATELEIDAIQPVLRLITSGHARAAARSELAAARATATATALRLAGRVEIACHGLLAAEQQVELRGAALAADDAAVTALESSPAPPAATELALARERDAREEARIDVARARTELAARREALNTLLGLSGSRASWTAAGELPDVPATAPAVDDLEATAVAASLDLAAGRARVEAADDRLGDERWHAILPDFGIGVSAIDRDHTWEWGPAVRVGLPIFDQRQGPRARAAGELAHAMHAREAVELALRGRARTAGVVALATYDEARRVRDVVIPLREDILRQAVLRYSAPDVDPYPLIAARQAVVAARSQYIDALRRYADAMTEVTALRRGAELGTAAAPP